MPYPQQQSKSTIPGAEEVLYQAKRILWLGHALWKTAFTCDHRQTPVHEGKCYCPSCGKGVIYRWVVLRCSGCRSKRDIQYHLRNWFPKESYCSQCGEHAVTQQFLENPKYHELHKACLVTLDADSFEKTITLQWRAKVNAYTPLALVPVTI